jgi:hypothetical protein
MLLVLIEQYNIDFFNSLRIFLMGTHFSIYKDVNRDV